MKIWDSTLDGKYSTFVERDKPYHGFLVIKEAGVELLREEVNISYDACFGPDAADVSEWESRCIQFIDKK